ncbi:MAG: helix-turn-helix transcriptional regulator [Acaryochloridaceae cyanobacterium RU_4_10]|nr:helix-turn-helix transcriptional regulator [Acaryochloridaceae cyanobacterium RU_4_10]
MRETEQCLEFQCPIQFVVDLIGNKWTILVLRELFGGDRRTHELLEALPGISTKILTQRLRELEHHGLADRRVYAEVPPHVEYSLTAKGRQIQPVLVSLYQVGTQWLEQDACICPLEQIQPMDRSYAGHP